MHFVELMIFDLDGTLVDSKMDIAFSLNKSLNEFDIPSRSEDEISQHVGYGVKPLLELAVTEHGKHEVELVFQHFQKLYAQHLLDKTRPYEGIIEILQHYSNKKKVVLTNKRQDAADAIIKGLDLSKHFFGVYGREAFLEHKPSPLPIFEICKLHNSNVNQSVMVGDTSADIRSGKSAGAKTCVVKYGYGSKEDLLSFAPDVVVHSPEEVKKYFM